MIAWDPALATGDETIDAQHQALFAMLAELCDASETDDDECIDAVLSRLVDYTAEHFSAEQALMARVAYPPQAVIAHTNEHIALRRDVAALMAQRSSGELDSVMTLSLFLHEWLREHIYKSDKALVRYVRANA